MDSTAPVALKHAAMSSPGFKPHEQYMPADKILPVSSSVMAIAMNVTNSEAEAPPTPPPALSSPLCHNLAPALLVCVEPVEVLVDIHLVLHMVTELATKHDDVSAALQQHTTAAAAAVQTRLFK
jgi:hypothetical protein